LEGDLVGGRRHGMSIYIPAPGSQLVVNLPNETMRAKVTKVVNRDLVLVEIGQPLVRTHHYRKGDIIACRREWGELGEYWEAVDSRLMFTPNPEWDENQTQRKPRKKKATA
jgi:hypothetical protein